MDESGFSVDGRRVVGVGAARSGVAAAELLQRRGASVTLSDSRAPFDDAARLSAAGIAMGLGGHKPRTVTEADLLGVSHALPTGQPAFAAARANDVEIIGELERASRWLRRRVLAVTRTKGKSPTTTLIGRMLSAAGRHVLV